MDQRKGQRFELRLPFELLRNRSDSRQGETKNLSSSGVLFQCAASLRIGEPVEYMITLPRARLRCIGKIVRFAKQNQIAATLERYEFIR